MRRGRRIASGRQYAAARQHPDTCTDSRADANTFTGADTQSNACACAHSDTYPYAYAYAYAYANTHAYAHTNADTYAAPASRQPDHFADRSKSVRDYVCVDADNLFGRQPSARRQRDGGSRRH